MIEPELLVPQINTAGLVARYKLQYAPMNATTVFDYSFGGKPGTLTGTNIAPVFPGFSFNGSDDFIDVGNQGGAIQTIGMWVKATSIAGNDYPIDLNGTDYLSIESGEVTANGFSGPDTIYVDGIVGTTITAGKWHFIAISHSSFTASDLDIGRAEGVGLFTGSIGEVLLFSDALEAQHIRSIYELTRSTYGR